MKRMVMILIAISVMSIAGPANAGITDLPRYQKLAALIDNYINSVDVAQADFIAVHGYYFQGLDLIDGEPNGVDNATGDNAKMPTDQEFSWFDFAPQVFGGSVALPVNIRIDKADSPFGPGYTIKFEFWRDLGQDADGTVGNHWVYMYYLGPDPEPTAIYNEWFIESDADL